MNTQIIIEEYCNELMNSPVIPNQEVMDNLHICANLVQHDIGYNYNQHENIYTVRFIRENIVFCSYATLETIGFLLLEQLSLCDH